MDKNLSALITIFGGTGDLSYRKLIPSVFNLYQKGHFNKLVILSTGLEDIDSNKYREKLKNILPQKEDPKIIDTFLDTVFYLKQDVEDSSSWQRLRQLTDQIDKEYNLSGNRLFYIAMNPHFFKNITKNIKKHGLADTSGFSRIIIEKPFGEDFNSAENLNNYIRQYFNEEDIFRIDHYLGKDMVQSIENLRFNNTIFEPIWNNKYISNIQITSSETLGVEKRGAYYDTTGALKDMVQNHLLQILALVAMERPSNKTSTDLRDRKIDVLKHLKVLKGPEAEKNFVRGQYDEGIVNNTPIIAYNNEKNVNNNSSTETFVSGKLLIDNDRWRGTPFYIRTGKRMKNKSIDIVIEFKKLNNNLTSEINNRYADCNLLVINIEPKETISLYISNKSLKHNKNQPIKLHSSSTNKPKSIDAYETLICDALIGDQTNFTHWEELKYSWKFIDNIKEAWSDSNITISKYTPGTYGPKESNELLENDGFIWWNNV